MVIGVPKEIKDHEYRVALLPSAAYQLVKRGHQVLVGRGAGIVLVADHLEVLYDLAVELAGIAAASGLGYARTSSLNDDPAFIATLADLVIAADGAA